MNRRRTVSRKNSRATACTANSLSHDGVFARVADDFDRPNGLAFSPDESVLYVNDTPRSQVRAFEVHTDGSLTHSRVLADILCRA